MALRVHTQLVLGYIFLASSALVTTTTSTPTTELGEAPAPTLAQHTATRVLHELLPQQ